jgi:hypothetical protein
MAFRSFVVAMWLVTRRSPEIGAPASVAGPRRDPEDTTILPAAIAPG